MHTFALLMLLAAEPSEVEPEAKEEAPDWNHGFHLTGEWGGGRTWLEEHGITFDIIYAAEVIANAAQQTGGQNATVTGHLDLAITIETEDLGLWPGGKFYAVGQTNHGQGINELVGSTSEISNIEAKPYIQLGEFFFEQALFKELSSLPSSSAPGPLITLRLGKQDANREFGTPRFGGNFLNNNFGLIPSTPFPSYPTNGLGATVVVQPVEWLAIKAMIIEGKPQVGSFGFDTAFVPDAGHFFIAGVAAKHTFGPNDRSTGTSSAGFFRQQGPMPDLTDDAPEPRMLESNYGFYVQHDERIYLHPEDKDDPRCLTVISRLGWSQPDRTVMPFFVGTSVAWHGMGSRQDDTVGIGFGYFTVAQQRHGTPGLGREFFVELFYKWRLTHFISLQPDLQYYRTPGGDGQDALLVGVRLKLKG